MRSLRIEVEPRTLLLKVYRSPTDLKLNKLHNLMLLLLKQVSATAITRHSHVHSVRQEARGQIVSNALDHGSIMQYVLIAVHTNQMHVLLQLAAAVGVREIGGFGLSK